VRAQQRPLLAVVGAGEVERVVHLHRRVVGREVERAEVVPRVLGLGAHRDREAELAEDRADLLDHGRDRVHRAAPARARRHREVDPRRGPGGRALPRLERVERVGDLGLERVERLAGGAPVLRQRARAARPAARRGARP
jgi:hypothetical protein